MYVLGARRFNTTFYQNAYQNFHLHLPEELFYTDFVTFFKKANSITARGMAKAYKQIATTDTNQAELLTKVIHEVILDSQVREDNPLVPKLVLYVQAHKNYLETLSYSELTESKINWGLKETYRIEQ